ncbi:MAG: hypothetical protein A3B96_01025 [Candidatus Spechtbacteria bacterium RIFCSPHIGHO2_02_FULL_43_15b]|uniref:DUF8128 domain-containing protein n=1 Tax=Candidatus Spechtbacteria bacterium RIFCSPHIGHO2_01_FULL_43_30 TaxID=1802158 RepID=A0A1G2H6Y2_9BACT|nr:MAG: hypothetical protein A2827_02270 [Candidatus Spechtbacteria bacterium RIFCSPHIGHO2_01_FULL_43_30]OGZ58997.1 MAG: hypothetical protein A3B96_01025 [Candidatus Spechtbacteria bacterium RIFCSPHIGHO2_02_FULL_43_15b]
MDFFSIPFLIVKASWWIITPLILFSVAKKSYLYWKQKLYIDKLKCSLLEVRLPQEVFKTPKAMEYVLAGMHGVWDELNFRDIWVKGEVLPWFSLEIVGTEGAVHFYIYTQTKLKEFVKENVYAQYPDAEIEEVEDYTEKLPMNIPNKYWDLWGTDLKLMKENPFPIRRYMEFEEIEEERRLDPIAQIAEVMNGLGRGEHMWIQTIIQPATDMNQLKKEGDEVITRLMKRDMKKSPGMVGGGMKSMQGELGSFLSLMLGMPQGQTEEKQERMFPPEFMLSPGERDVVKAVEEKTSKLAYETMMRFLYIGRSDVFNKANIPALFGFFRHFNTFNLNSLVPNSKTLPKKSFFAFKNTRGYFRKMRLFNWYKYRSTLPGNISTPFLLNVEELASLFHFPGQTVKAPQMTRVLSKRPSPPPGLPIE